MTPQNCSQLNAPGAFHPSLENERIALFPPAAATMPFTAVACSDGPAQAAPLQSPDDGQPVSRLMPDLPEQRPSTIWSWEATKEPAWLASTSELKKGWMLQPTTSTTSQRTSTDSCQMLRGSVVVHGPEYPAPANEDLELEMNDASSLAEAKPEKMASFPMTISSTRDHWPQAMMSVTCWAAPEQPVSLMKTPRIIFTPEAAQAAPMLGREEQSVL